jgi:1-acyl-sn-glycerol-3-phosphate acyltransferase
LASNHTSFYDWLVLPLVVRRRIIFLAKSSYFTGRGLRGRLRRHFFTACRQVPVDRSGGGAGEAALRTAVRLVGEGQLLGVFPPRARAPRMAGSTGAGPAWSA